NDNINSKIKRIGPSEFWRRARTKAMMASAFLDLLHNSSRQRVADLDENTQHIYQLRSPETTDIARRYLGTPFTISKTVQDSTNHMDLMNSPTMLVVMVQSDALHFPPPPKNVLQV
ncbi:unnamed protein product, partial [Allacma fusca]